MENMNKLKDELLASVCAVHESGIRSGRYKRNDVFEFIIGDRLRELAQTTKKAGLDPDSREAVMNFLAKQGDSAGTPLRGTPYLRR